MAEVVDVTIESTERIRVVFDDGVELDIPLVELRTHCPCAGCRGQLEAGRAPWTPSPGRGQPRVLDASLVGAWGLSVRWDDGHDTGIYSWDSLRAGHHPRPDPTRP
jgi:DUF971 family protein